jgi:AcrR family transcriptional regulator
VTTIAEQEHSRTRATPMAPDDRRAMIIDAVIPLLMEKGREVTTRQIAEAADIAEGTIFRVFGDKESLFEAAVEKFLDPTESHKALMAIDPDLPLEAKVNDILFQLRNRMTGIFGIMQAVGMSGPPPRGRRERPRDHFEDVIAQVLAPDLARMNASAKQVASFVRQAAFASAIPHFNEGHQISTADLARLITYGIAGHPAEGGSPDAS